MTVLGLAFASLALSLYRPLFREARTTSSAVAAETPNEEAGSALRQPFRDRPAALAAPPRGKSLAPG
jgi:hypothetical protein